VSRPLRIGIDARELLGQTTGVGRYLGELLRRWTVRSDAGARRLVLYAPEKLRVGFAEGAVDIRVLPGGRGTWWEQTALGHAVRRDKPDVFFAPAYTAPLGTGTPLAVTIHDISFIAHPEWFRPRERWRRRVLTTRAARTASVVFTDSEFSRREIEQRLKVPPSRLQVIPPGVLSPIRDWRVTDREPRAASRESEAENVESRAASRELEAENVQSRAASRESQAENGESRAASREPRAPLVLFVGSLFNRRRLPDLIHAFARATADRPDARLAIVGADRTWPRQDLHAVAASAGVGHRTDIADYLPGEDLAKLYTQASVFAFLSEYEGFGLTPLEALAADVPIVTLDTPVAREVYGPSAEYVARGDIDGTAAALRRFLESPAAARNQLAHASAVLARYSWDHAADETLRHIEAVARQSAGSAMTRNATGRNSEHS
jgi:glycosyltransferase involved in cell wall biosynthesis